MFKQTISFETFDESEVTVSGFDGKDSAAGYSSILLTANDGYEMATAEMTAQEARRLAAVLLNAADHISKESTK